MTRVHIVGAGLAGLSAAIQLAKLGVDVIVHEQSGQAGGRARSFHDATLDCVIDNGNHLLLSGNMSALGYLATIGAQDRLTGPDTARFDFHDLGTGERWALELDEGRIPYWVFKDATRVPGTDVSDYIAGLKLLIPGNATVSDLFAGREVLFRRFWEPFCIAVLNTQPDQAVAKLLLPVIRETLAKGAAASKPLIARHGLSDTFVDPALTWLQAHGADIRFGARIANLKTGGGQISALVAASGEELLGPGDQVILAVPPWAARDLCPDVLAPTLFAPIVNVHYRLAPNTVPRGIPAVTGLIGSDAQWLFMRDDVASVTISAADAIAQQPADEIGRKVWTEVAQTLDMDPKSVPKVRVIKERRATFLATAEQIARRPKPETSWRNLTLAGDWTDTGLPATIEGSIRSGDTASRLVHNTLS